MSDTHPSSSGFAPLFSGPDRLRGAGQAGPASPGAAGLRWPRAGRPRRFAEDSGPPEIHAVPYLIPPQPVAEAPDSVRPPVRLSGARWLETEGVWGGSLTARVEAEPARDPATRVIFRAAIACDGGNLELPPVEGHIDPESGIATAVIVLPEEPPEGGRGPGATEARAHFTARHSRSAQVSAAAVPVRKDRTPAFDGMLFYSPARDEYLAIADEEDFKPLLGDILGLETLRDKAKTAWRNPDPAIRAAALRDLEPEADALLGKGGADPRGGALEELLLVRGNRRWGDVKPWVHIPAHERSRGQVQVLGHWRKAQDSVVRKQLDLLLRPRSEKLASPFLNTRFRANLFEGRRKPGEPWRWKRWPDSAEPGKPEKDPFTWSSEAALGRFFAGWDGADASWDPRKRALKIGTAGNAGFALLEGKVNLAIELPEPDGLDVLPWLGRVKGRERREGDPSRTCRLKAKVEGSLSAFAGVSLYGTLAVAGSPSKVSADAGAGAFAGARTDAGFRLGLHWSPSARGPFAALGTVRYGAGLSAAAAAEAGLRVDYEDGVLRFRLSAAASLGLGFKLDQGFDVGVKDAFRLVGHIFACLDFHFAAAVSREAFAAYRDFALAVLTARSEAEAAAVRNAGEALDWARRSLGEWDDRLRSAGEAVAGAKRALEARIGERSLLRLAPPEALGRALALVLRTREDGDFRTLRYLLASTVRPGARPEADPSANHKLKWTLRCASGTLIPEGPGREAAKTEALRAGIARLRDFARARGEWRGGQTLAGEAAFADWLEAFLAENGLRE